MTETVTKSRNSREVRDTVGRARTTNLPARTIVVNASGKSSVASVYGGRLEHKIWIVRCVLRMGELSVVPHVFNRTHLMWRQITIVHG